MDKAEWTEKGASLSDKSACLEFGLTQKEIIEAIRKDVLQYRKNSMHGNPYLRLLRSEVEKWVAKKYGKRYLKTKLIQNELAQTTKEIRKIKRQLKALEKIELQLSETLNKLIAK